VGIWFKDKACSFRPSAFAEGFGETGAEADSTFLLFDFLSLIFLQHHRHRICRAAFACCVSKENLP